MGDQRLRILLEHRCHDDGRHLVAHIVEAVQEVAGEQKVDAPGRQQRAVVDLRPALTNLDIEAVALVGAVDQSLIKAALRGFGLPVDRENDLLLSSRRHARQDQCQCDETGIAGCKHLETPMECARRFSPQYSGVSPCQPED